MLPTFVVIGAQKSASSFMQLCLAEHPDIYMAEGETPFFETPDYEQSDISELEMTFQGRGEKCLGIKRPNYIGKPEVPARIRRHLPSAKLIAVLRNPIDRAVLAYFHNIYYGFLPPLDVEIGMRRIISDPSFVAKYKRSPEVIEFGYYYKQLIKYDHYIQADRLLAILHEDICINPIDSIQHAYEFLNVSRSFIPGSLSLRPQKVLYNMTRLKFLCHQNRFLYQYKYEKTRRFPKQMTLVDKILAKCITAFDQKLLSRFLPNNKPKIGLQLHKMLLELYSSDIDALQGLINRDLSAWKHYK